MTATLRRHSRRKPGRVSVDDFFSISGDVLRDAEKASEYKMRVPPTARPSNRNPDVHFWEEAGTITATNSGTYTADNGVIVKTFVYEVTCSAEGSGENIGFVIKNTLRLAPSAIATGQPEGYAKMSYMSINRLMALLRGVGIQPDGPDGGFTSALLKTCFPPEDAFATAASPLVGKTIRFELKHGPLDGRDGKRRWIPEITTIFEPV